MATRPGPGNSGLYSNFSYPSQVMGRNYTAPITHAGNAPVAVLQTGGPIATGKKIQGWKGWGGRSPPIIASRQMVGGFLGDASISATGSDTGVSDPLPFNWASLLNTAVTTGGAAISALHPATIPHAPTPIAAGPSPVLVAAGVGILGLAAYLAFSKPRR